MTRRRLVTLALVLVFAAAGVVVVLTVSDGERSAGVSPRPTASAEPPEAPVARVCGNRAVLDGPESPPDGAVRVSTSDPLDELTRERPAGTTFWLEPGTHRLGTHAFDQVIPKEGNVYVGAPGAVLDGQRQNKYAFTGSAPDVTIRNLTIRNFGERGGNSDEGVVNHNAADGWTLEHNTVTGNAGAGVMIGSGNVVRENCLSRNGQYGFNAYSPDPLTDIVIRGNEIAGNNTYDWERKKPGCGCTGGGKFWMVDGALVVDNWVHDNHGAGLWADMNNRSFTIEGNYIEGNDAEGIFYEASYNARISGNTFVRNGLVKGRMSPDFPTAAVYISESGSDSRVDGKYGEEFEITGNVFVDNWSGVILWENADRFAGSPANTSTGVGTLVNPDVVTAKTCNARNITEAPYYDDCRWKTQNVHVHHNEFSIDQDAVGARCDTSHGCGYNGIFANWGTFPDWSPYMKETVQDDIVFEQGNRFNHNEYEGTWAFVVHGQGTRVNWATWQSAPYRQDTDSVISPAPGTASPGSTGG